MIKSILAFIAGMTYIWLPPLFWSDLPYREAVAEWSVYAFWLFILLAAFLASIDREIEDE